MNGLWKDSQTSAPEILLDIRQLQTTFFTHVGRFRRFGEST